MAKGQVKIEPISGRLRLRWSYNGKRHCLSIGLPDNPINQSFALQKAKQIELDMVSGNFDATLEKYKPEKLEEKQAFPKRAQPQTFTEAMELHWEDFIEYKQSRIDNPSTILTMYRPLERKLSKFGQPIESYGDAKCFVEWLLKQISGTTAKKYLNTLNNFNNWLVAQELVEESWRNPFVGLKEICREKPKLKEPPFTKEEIQAILAAFQADKDYCYYLGYVRLGASSGSGMCCEREKGQG